MGTKEEISERLNMSVGLRAGNRPPDLEKVTALLADGADPNWKDANGNTTMHYCASPEAATLLLAKGANIHVQNHNGSTPLFYQIACPPTPGHLSVIQILIDRGADVNARSGGGMTPLDNAIRTNNTGAIQILTANGGQES